MLAYSARCNPKYPGRPASRATTISTHVVPALSSAWAPRGRQAGPWPTRKSVDPLIHQSYSFADVARGLASPGIVVSVRKAILERLNLTQILLERRLAPGKIRMFSDDSYLVAEFRIQKHVDKRVL